MLVPIVSIRTLGDDDMRQMKRIAIFVDDELLTEARYLANQQGQTLTELIQEALRDYVRRRQSARRISFTGLRQSGQPDLWRREEDILTGEVSATEGWAFPYPRRDTTTTQDFKY